MTRVLVTGATGFVGMQILKALSKDGINILPVVRSGKEGLVAELPHIEKVISSPDIFSETPSWWSKQCRDVDVVVHAAWYAEPTLYLQSPLNINCLSGSLNLAMGVVNAGVRRFVGVGTCFEYDLSGGILSIDTPLRPTTPYASSKAALFFTLSQWLPAQAIEFAWCRLFYLYGEGEDERRLAPYLRKKMMKGELAQLTSGKQIRDFLDVREAGKRISEITQGHQVGPINICSGIPITVRQFAERIADEYGQKNLLRFGERADNLIDPQCVLGIPN